MAIEKMKLLGIKGESKNLDRFLANVLLKIDIQIEDAKKIYNKGWKLEYFGYDYKIKETLRKCENLLKKLDIPFNRETDLVLLKNHVSDIVNKIEEINSSYDESVNIINTNQKKTKEILEKIEKISKIEDMDIDIQKLYNLRYIKFRYGSIPKRNLEEIKREIDNLNLILFELKEENDISWIMYFTTPQYVSEIDGIFNIQKFEREMLPDDLLRTPKEYIRNLKEQIRQIEFSNSQEEEKIKRIRKMATTKLLELYSELQTYNKINNIKKYIVHDQNDTYYIVAWVSEENLSKIEKQLNELNDVNYVVKDGTNPPTKLKNNKLIKPFEELVKMYGMPKIEELDPTWFVALTTFIMFGFMFGDVGHGLIFLIIGILLLIKRQKTYGAILFAGGLSSMIFGILYGSVFGKENIIKPIIISPMNNITTMLLYGILVGTVFILMAMVLNIINGVKNKDYKRIFLDKNGIAGIALYMFVLINVGYYFLANKMLISINIIVIISLILVIAIMFSDKIMNFLEKKRQESSTPFVEKIFEIIEMLLSFLSNTISFLRLAAFAINHAGLCMAVYLLADMGAGAGNILIAVIGNIVVLVLEGLIVGIQTLRLEYYELFSRFYDGSGQEYKSIKSQIEE